MKEKLSSKMPQLRVDETTRAVMDEMTEILDRRDLTDFHRLLLRKVAEAYKSTKHKPGRINICFEFILPGR